MIHSIPSNILRGLLAGTAALVLAMSFGCESPGGGGHTISATELADRIETGAAPLILDVRTPGEFKAGHIPGAINIPHDQIASRISELPANRSEEIVVHCQSGRRAVAAEAELERAGYSNLRDLDGHWAAWSAAGLPKQ